MLIAKIKYWILWAVAKTARRDILCLLMGRAWSCLLTVWLPILTQAHAFNVQQDLLSTQKEHVTHQYLFLTASRRTLKPIRAVIANLTISFLAANAKKFHLFAMDITQLLGSASTAKMAISITEASASIKIVWRPVEIAAFNASLIFHQTLWLGYADSMTPIVSLCLSSVVLNAYLDITLIQWNAFHSLLIASQFKLTTHAPNAKLVGLWSMLNV